MRVLITGSTGYIGGRLVPLILKLGHEVAVLVRNKERAAGFPWGPDVEIIEGDLLKPDQPWSQQLSGFDAAYYLVHSMYTGDDFQDLDKQAALNFAKAVGNIKHCIYVGGLLPPQEPSKHLKSRAETGEVLAEHLPTTEFRAGPIIGSGSASFEMVRYLTERLPIMLTPKWIYNEVQPIAIRNVLEYLIMALDKDPLGIVDIGGDPMRFKDMMMRYANVRGLKRKVFALPVLTPRLASMWVGLVTPIPHAIAIPLVEGINHPVVGSTEKAQKEFPDVKLLDYEESVRRAIQKFEKRLVETSWSSALTGAEGYEIKDAEGMVQEVQAIHVNAPQEYAFKAFMNVGGENAWPAWDWAWRIRGIVDRMLGGPGMRKGARPTHELRPGDTIDFWRVEKVVPGEELLLRAEMKVPGKAWLRFQAKQDESPMTSTIIQTAYFQPKGLAGTLYWYAMYPAHLYIFPAMAKHVGKQAEKLFRKEA